MENTEKQDPLLFLWSSRKFVISFTAGFTALAVVFSLLLPSQFTSTATLLPETGKGIMGSVSSLSDLASFAGIDVGGGADMTKQYPSIIMSEAVLRNVLLERIQTINGDTTDLLTYLGIGGESPRHRLDAGLKVLRRMIDVEIDRNDGIVRISLETGDPKVSAEAINNVVRELDAYIRTKRASRASEQRKWIQIRLTEVEQELRSAEDSQKEFMEKNRRVMDSPKLLLETARRQREIEINSAVYVELKKQFEIVRIEEVRSTPVVNVLDMGQQATERSSPKRRLIVINFFFFSLLAALTIVVVQFRYGRLIERIVGAIRDKKPQNTRNE